MKSFPHVTGPHVCILPPNPLTSFTWHAKTEQSGWENLFVHWLLNVRTRGDLSLTRRCRNCRRWFYAVTNHQTSCTDRCRQQIHSRNERFKENRRLYMRRYRKAEQSRNWVAEQAVKVGRRIGGAALPLRDKKGGS
jgi:hypothetical protein